MKETTDSDALSIEVQEVMRNLVSAIRGVKIYPPNNPVYAQAIKKSYQTLNQFLEQESEYRAGVQKGWFTFQRTPIGKDAQLNKAIAQDLFAKGIRELVFLSGVTETELLELYRALALPTEELAMKGGLSSVLWEKGAGHIKVTEAGLDEVITSKADGGWEEKTPVKTPEGGRAVSAEKIQDALSGRTLVLGSLMNDPSGFGVAMVELAKETRGSHEGVEDRLFTLYQEAGRKIQEGNAEERDAMFDGLAKSVLAMDQPYRDGMIAGKLYGELDAEIAGSEETAGDQHYPTALHEIQTGRFSGSWTVQQVSTLLKRTSAKKAGPSAPPPSPSQLEAVPIPPDLAGIAKELAVYSPEEMTALKAIGEAGMESDIIQASVRTLIYLLPLVKRPRDTGSAEKELALFSAVVRQLEDLLGYLLKKKDYEFATRIIKALQMPVEPAFKSRVAEALRKAAPRAVISQAIAELRKLPGNSPEYQSVYAYVSTMDRAATEVLLELLAGENDQEARTFLTELVKDLGKNQLALLGERLSDGRGFFVRNIIAILGESKTDQALTILRKAADHVNVQVRLEVIKGLLTIGGKKVAGVLAKFLRDTETEVQKAAILAFGELSGIGAEESTPLAAFLEGRPLRKKEQELTLDAIATLGKIGGRDAALVLQGYLRIRWWKSKKLQTELRDAAMRAIADIERRTGHAGR
jgi:HEAT repeat protein